MKLSKSRASKLSTSKTTSKNSQPSEERLRIRKKLRATRRELEVNEKVEKKKEKGKFCFSNLPFAKQPTVWRRNDGELMDGRCDSWQKVGPLAAHWHFFFGTLLLISSCVFMSAITIAWGTFDPPIEDGKPTEVESAHCIVALLVLVHVWCLLRWILLGTNREIAYEIFYGISISMTMLSLAIGAMATFYFKKSYLILAYGIAIFTSLLILTVVLHQISGRQSAEKLPEYMKVYLKTAKREMPEEKKKK